MSFIKDTPIRFDPGPHTYTNIITGEVYESVSRILKVFQQEFDTESISSMCAWAEIKKVGGSFDTVQARIKKEWKDKANKAAEHGTRIHKELEIYFITGSCSEDMLPLAKRIHARMGTYNDSANEVLFWSEQYKKAGTADRVIKRRKSSNVIDYYDYKTNIDKGIYYDSIKRKDDKETHYDRYLKAPVDYLEDCNYNSYALQLSAYALFGEECYGWKAGKLTIISIKPDLTDFRFIAVPYMKHSIQSMLIQYSLSNS
jgi:hypothetical protein